jgi:hypothetical protein
MAGGGIVLGLGFALVAVFALQKTGVAQTIVNYSPIGRAAPRPAPEKKPAPKKEPAPGEDASPDEAG